MSNWTIYALFVIGLLAVIKGGDWLVESAVWLAGILGIPQVIVGATIVSMGTTLPETMIGSFAAIADSGDIVIGTALGSVLCNTGLILGLNNVVRPTIIEDTDTFLKVGSMIGVVVLLGIFGANGMVSGIETWILLLLLAAYVAINIWASTNGKHAHKVPYTTNDLWKNGIYFFVGLLLVVVGARLLLDSGISIARIYGISEAVIAVTLFAVGSSLPELVTSIAAAIKGHNGIFFGNILGANILNILMVVGVSSAINPIAITRDVLFTQIPMTLLLMGVLVMPAFITKKISKAQGLVAFLLYLTYIIYLTMY